jgi:DNA repair exonuclease SbcCD ATPase subunit
MINFKKIKFKNFGSFGNTFSEIDFQKSQTTLVSGSNGNGKSFAFLDAITFALFGNPFRNINIPQLVNSVNKGKCLVELEFEINKTEYMIRRGLAPKVFEIYKNGEMIEQAAKTKDYQDMLENQILKMNRKTFMQVIILGKSSFVPFMELPPADRRQVIETILDIDVFSSMNLILKGKLSQIRESIKINKLDQRVIDEKIKLYETNLKNLQSNMEKSLEVLDNKIKEATEEIDGSKRKIKLLNKEILQEGKKLEQYKITDEDLASLREKKADLTVNINTINEELEFFNNNETCPTCKQAIEETHKCSIVSTKKNRLVKLGTNAEEIINSIAWHNDILTKSKEVQERIKELVREVKSLEREVASLEKVKAGYEADKHSVNEDQIASTKEQLESVKIEKKVKETALISLEKQQNDHELVVDLLKDSGIKGKIINHYLPIINKLVNKNLSNMGFFVKFNLDGEFNEKIESRHRDEFSYLSFSEGEKMRIDISLLLAWREVARMKNSLHCNLLILDEVFDSSLDSIGTDELMKLLNGLKKGCNVFVISHKTDQLHDKFKNTVTLEKKNNFSKLVQN